MRSIRCSSKYAPIVHQLSDNSPFQTMRDVMCFAAALGFDRDTATDLAESSGDIVDARIFQRSPEAMDMLAMVGIGASENLDLMHPTREDELVQLFERYAETGLRFLSDMISDAPEDVRTTKIVDFLIDEFRPADDTTEGDPHDTDF